ncbi:Dimethylsulfide dehydrogenase subunit alpha [Gossypium arboreum]|uniref:Dimethylsulfide dehydrogenase subunit alpha n=1 Tax=Gossypium arboreum TaxID=29729 RepID=A0A0B0PHF3_GOSAR|nr:Dimethylsulfide dehydrogenase subunit alpha [Gossypium arboreum]
MIKLPYLRTTYLGKFVRDNVMGHSREYVREFKELMLQVSDVTEKEELLVFQNGLKSWVRHEVEQIGFQKLLEAMTVAKSVSDERDACEKDHKEDVVDGDGNGNGDNGGNGKPQVEKKKPNRKMDELKCFLCDGPHMLKKFPKKFALKKKPVGKALVLSLTARGVKAKGPKKSIIEGDDGADKELEKLGSSKGKVEAKRAERNKKK